jgi:D-alanyl-D-alanine carboxypeptidase
MNQDNTKRKKDVSRHEHMHSFALIGLIGFFILLNFLSSSPKIFSKSIEKNNLFSINNESDKNIHKSILNLQKKWNLLEKKENNFKDLEIKAKSFVVFDFKEDKIIYSRNENDILPLASLTKVITAITAIHLQDYDTDILIKKSLMREDENLDIGMKEGQRWKMGELLKYGLTISSNSSMDIVASSLSYTNKDFVKEMNNYVRNLGFKDFIFNSASGLDYGDIIGGKGSALEFAKLFAKSYELIPDIMSYTINSKVDLRSNSEKIYQIPNTNKGAGHTVGLLASKTGFTEAAGGNLAIIFNSEVDHPVVIVVLGSSFDGRFQDVDKLYRATLDYLN